MLFFISYLLFIYVHLDLWYVRLSSWVSFIPFTINISWWWTWNCPCSSMLIFWREFWNWVNFILLSLCSIFHLLSSILLFLEIYLRFHSFISYLRVSGSFQAFTIALENLSLDLPVFFDFVAYIQLGLLCIHFFSSNRLLRSLHSY